MEFLVPGTRSNEERDKIYGAVKTHLSGELGAEISLRRIYSLDYVHNCKSYRAVVGQEESGGEGMVIVILFDQRRSLYLVCTPHRGVIDGSPILVGEHDVRAVVDFD